MKKAALLLIAGTIVFFTGCDPKNSKEYIAAQQQIDSLRTIVQTRDNDVKSLFDALTEIEDNLSSVSSKFQKVDQMKRTDNEVNRDTRSKINAQINDISEILSENKRKLSSLNEQLKKSNLKVKELTGFVARLETRINEQETQIQTLVAELEEKKIIIKNLSGDVEMLTKQNTDKERLITQKTLEANTAYYIIGTKKELKEGQIVNKEGGFIGIGSQTVLNHEADNSKFTKIDISQTPVIKIPPTKKAKIVTSHPNVTYELVKNGEGKIEMLKIDNVQEFWKMSRYLVIMID